MNTSDLENDFKQLLVSAQERDEFGALQRQLSCRVSAVCHYQIGVLADKVNMTRTALAERLLEQATSIAWTTAGLGDLRTEDIEAIKASAKSSVNEKGLGYTLSHSEGSFSRVNCIDVVFKHLGLETGTAKDSNAVAISSDGSTRICCLTSKDHDAGKYGADGERYWFTIHKNQLEEIGRGKKSYVTFGCGSTKQIIVVPASEFSTWTKDLPPYTQGKAAWHVQVRKASGRWEIRREGRGVPSIDVTKFVI